MHHSSTKIAAYGYVEILKIRDQHDVNYDNTGSTLYKARKSCYWKSCSKNK